MSFLNDFTLLKITLLSLNSKCCVSAERKFPKFPHKPGRTNYLYFPLLGFFFSLPLSAGHMGTRILDFYVQWSLLSFVYQFCSTSGFKWHYTKFVWKLDGILIANIYSFVKTRLFANTLNTICKWCLDDRVHMRIYTLKSTYKNIAERFS